MSDQTNSTRILRTRDEFSGVTAAAIIHANEGHALWMDHVFGKSLEALVERLGMIQEILQTAGDDPAWKALPAALVDAMWIDRESVNGLMAAYQLVRHGYWQESLVVVRHVIEMIAVSIHLWKEPTTMHEEFRKGNWDPKRSIKPAKHMLPYIGKMYGHLSEHAHPRRFLLGKSAIGGAPRSDGRIEYSIGGGMYRSNEFFFRHALRDVLSAAFLLHAAVELMLPGVTEFRFWKVDGQRGTAEWHPVDEEEHYIRGLDHLGASEENLVADADYENLARFADEHMNSYEMSQHVLEEVRERAGRRGT
jgi:hypothetical protein